MASTQIKYVRINLTKEAKDSCAENNKTLLKRNLKEKKMERHPMFTVWKT